MRLLKFKGESTLKRAGLKLLVNMLNQSDLKDLRVQFEAIDKEHNGLIDVKELGKILKSKGLKTDDKEIKKIIDQLDFMGNGKINYSEFLSATIDIQNHASEQNL